MPIPRTPPKMFETRSQAWKEVGLLRQINPKVVKRARLEALVLLPLFVGVVLLYDNRISWFGEDRLRYSKGHVVRDAEGHPVHHKVLEHALQTPFRIATVLILVVLGWAIARDVGRGLGPPLFRRLDPATAGTVGFLIRLVTIVVALLVALRVAGIPARELALGGAFTAVIFGLAAQQTLGNLIAGTVLLSARPFRVGERVRLQGGPLAGQIEGTVSSLGLLYTTFATGDDSIMVPNSVVLNVAILPLREPDAVNLRARLRGGMTPGDLQEVLEGSLQTPLRGPPRITLEELDGDEVVVRIAATPRVASQGRHLASELLAIVSEETRQGDGDGETAAASPSAAGDGAAFGDVGGNGGDGAGKPQRTP
jgi:small-conductance mechanosensitive channel